MSLVPAYPYSGTEMHAAPVASPTRSLCGARVLPASGDYVTAALAGGPLRTLCVDCLREVTA